MGNRTAMIIPSHEALSKLASDDPTAFEALREELVSTCINNAPERLHQRLHGIQFRVDSIRRLSRSPLGALVKIQALMWRSFLDLDRKLNAFPQMVKNAAAPGNEPAAPSPAGGARVIAFRPRVPRGKN